MGAEDAARLALKWIRSRAVDTEVDLRAIEKALAERDALRKAQAPCYWKEYIDGSCWETTCGNSFVIIDATPTDNGMKFCCFCGQPLKERKGPHANR